MFEIGAQVRIADTNDQDPEVAGCVGEIVDIVLSPKRQLVAWYVVRVTDRFGSVTNYWFQPFELENI